MNRAAKRLLAYLETCISRARRGGRYWLRLPLAEFMKATGYSLRTARAAWAAVRDSFATRLLRRGRSSVSMFAIQGTRSPCNPQYIGGNSSSLEKRNNTEHAPQTARTTDKFRQAGKDRDERPAKPVRDPLRRLAAWFGSRLRSAHWDTCRVRYNPGFAAAFAAKAFALGYSRDTIEAAYSAALRDEHAVASDVGAASWRPFRVFGLALRRLATVAPDWQRPATPPPREERPAASGVSDALAAFCASIATPSPFESYTAYSRY